MISQIQPATLFLLFFLLIFIIIIISSSIKIVTEYERVVIFRVGRLKGAKGPGLVIILPIIDRRRIIDLRLLTMDVPKQRIITKDNVTVDVDAVVYFRVSDPIAAAVKVKDYVMASSLLAQTTLRDVIGQVELDELLSKREELSKRVQAILDELTEAWGVKVTAVAIRDVIIPEAMQRAMAKQAEAERERRSRVIMAEGELEAAKKMAEAAEYYTKSPIALRLRELQTWSEIAREKNMIVVTESTSSQLGTLLGVIKSEKKE
ncbi:MAG: slipin family protein [Thaumarchaeota archaeon]|jgi:regulator of protease activity HflC (stomatin/prohibitin superfamily)|nr:slipin family protein [Candidatus Geocrenenecus arthurdayi]MCL7389164.1 slipin family protein [Candidatus Geocrenenecus arthurdayi]MCL7390747.1 slipin family protein [Candidatus Geocrenenecus arthurdayi]MCL7396623.1 slipin family protein [Candidatus Geocrenenecus arthurdayi]MCL7401586.1 slipin family protein [Candidatus Geocrenenecus arthurdayi]